MKVKNYKIDSIEMINITILQVKTYAVTPLKGKYYTTSSTIGVMT